MNNMNKKTILQSAAAVLIAIIFWCGTYYGVSSQLMGRIIYLQLIFGAGAGLFYVIFNSFSERAKINLPYLLFSVLFAVPIYLYFIERFLNSRFVDIITTKSSAGMVVTSFIVLLIVLFYQLLGYIVHKSLKRFERPAFVFVTLLSVFLPAFTVSSEQYRTYSGENYKLLNRVMDHRKGGLKGRVIVVGIDGATWDVIDPLLKKGKMPNMKYLMDGGGYGVLLSDERARSPVVWTTIFTGVPPEVHGIDTWEGSLSTNRRVKAIWNIFNEYDKKAVVVNVPGTFPPEKVDGFMISGFPVPMVTHNNFGIFFSTDGAKGVDIPHKKIHLETVSTGGYSKRAELSIPVTLPVDMSEIIKDPDWILSDRYSLHNFFVEFLINRTIRTAGRSRELKLYLFMGGNNNSADLSFSKDGDTIAATIGQGEWSPPIYRRFDNNELFFKVKLIKADGKDMRLFVTPFYRSVKSKDVPYFFPSSAKSMPLKLTDEYIVEGPGWGMLNNMDVTEAFWEMQRDTLRLRAGYIDSLFKKDFWNLFVAVYTITDRIQHSFWKFREPDYFDDVDNISAESFGDVIDRAYIAVDKRLGEIIRGLKEDDLLVVISDHGFQRAGAASKDNHSGRHKREGIFVFYGRGIRKGVNKSRNGMLRAHILDITPTVLYLSGFSVAEDMPGKIIRDVIDEGFLKAHPVKTTATYNRGIKTADEDTTIEESTKEQLKSLGYIQ